MKQIDPKEKICPLCGVDNKCAAAAGRPAESCWCQGVTFNKESLAAIPEEAKDKYCLCPACGRVSEDAPNGG
ncbi:MAG: hypothetical protein ACI9JM_001343 [Halioglobus sp.]|jgi:hypothetical protein